MGKRVYDVLGLTRLPSSAGILDAQNEAQDHTCFSGDHGRFNDSLVQRRRSIGTAAFSIFRRLPNWVQRILRAHTTSLYAILNSVFTATQLDGSRKHSGESPNEEKDDILRRIRALEAVNDPHHGAPVVSVCED
jgi:hypothetical protein